MHQSGAAALKQGFLSRPQLVRRTCAQFSASPVNSVPGVIHLGLNLHGHIY